MEHVQKDMLAYLSPLQLGVGTPERASSIAHTCRNIIDSHEDPDWVVLQVDFKNAFNWWIALLFSVK